MNFEENVYEKMTRTEETQTEITGAEECKSPENASTVLGKFKSVDALAQAYSALQAEFTRRSQRLKKLEREAENFKAETGVVGDLGVEKLRKNAKAKREESRRFDAFVADVVAESRAEKPVINDEENLSENVWQETEDVENTAVSNAVDNAEKIEDKDGGERLTEKADAENAVNNAAESVNAEGEGKAVARTEETVLSSEMIYQKAVGDEKVRLRIIGEYLDSIGKSGAPVTCGNAGLFAAPPLRAKSIADAGGMALHYFRKSNS